MSATAENNRVVKVVEKMANECLTSRLNTVKEPLVTAAIFPVCCRSSVTTARPSRRPISKAISAANQHAHFSSQSVRPSHRPISTPLSAVPQRPASILFTRRAAIQRSAEVMQIHTKQNRTCVESSHNGEISHSS